MPRRSKKPAKVAYRLLPRAEHPAMYQRLEAIVHAHHEELRDARIAVAWCTSWRPDVDGNVTIGRCKRASALDRELHEWDFVILLNERYWNDERTTAIAHDALLDHELCHATVKIDPETNDPALDERGRVIYRLRRHDLEEFACIAQRYGIWKRDLQRFAKALKDGPQVKLPLDQEAPAPAPRQVH